MTEQAPHPEPGIANRANKRLQRFVTSADGSLLDDTAFNQRHRAISGLGWALTLFVTVFTIADSENVAQWLYPPAMLAAMLVAASGRFDRRPREVAVAVTFVLTQLFLSRYVGNISGFSAVLVIVLTFYQDWVPIALTCVCALALVVVAVIEPSVFDQNQGFQREAPLAGTSFRAFSIIAAATLALAVWRSGTQLARDQLTGMLSRAGAERILDRDIASGRQPAAWVCDIDNFRTTNADIGPAAGDQLLREVARRLKNLAATLPGGGICARLGADTFLIAAHRHPGEAQVEAYAHRIEAEAGWPVAGIAADEVPVRLSVGAATALPGEAAAALIRIAEGAMRQAKGRGTARVVVKPREREVVQAPPSPLLSELYRACAADELELHYQPIVSLADARPMGAEALARWRHPTRGMVFPGAFLPAAEADSALMATLSESLGKRFARDVLGIVNRHDLDWLPYGFSYNLAAIRLRDPTLVENIADLLAYAGRTSVEGRISLEVTEGALTDIEHEVPETLRGLRDKGYKIALDDFGTGHSSLAHLRDFPLDTVKIDKSFVAAMDRSPIDLAVVQAVCDVAAAAGWSVVAEGVETERQREQLLAVKPDILAQGWLFAKAMPLEEFEQWVLDRSGTVNGDPRVQGAAGQAAAPRVV